MRMHSYNDSVNNIVNAYDCFSSVNIILYRGPSNIAWDSGQPLSQKNKQP